MCGHLRACFWWWPKTNRAALLYQFIIFLILKRKKSDFFQNSSFNLFLSQFRPQNPHHPIDHPSKYSLSPSHWSSFCNMEHLVPGSHIRLLPLRYGTLYFWLSIFRFIDHPFIESPSQPWLIHPCSRPLWTSWYPSYLSSRRRSDSGSLCHRGYTS